MSTSKGPFTISWALFQQFLNFNEDFRWFKAQRNGYFALFDAAAAVTESSAAVKVVSTEFWDADS